MCNFVTITESMSRSPKHFFYLKKCSQYTEDKIMKNHSNMYIIVKPIQSLFRSLEKLSFRGLFVSGCMSPMFFYLSKNPGCFIDGFVTRLDLSGFSEVQSLHYSGYMSKFS